MMRWPLDPRIAEFVHKTVIFGVLNGILLIGAGGRNESDHPSSSWKTCLAVWIRGCRIRSLAPESFSEEVSPIVPPPR